MKKRARPEQDLPRPLELSEHVLCSLQPDAYSPLLPATVISLDETYKTAANNYLRTPHHHNPHNHVIDLEAEAASASHPTFHPPRSPGPIGRILFREAADHHSNTQSPPSPTHHKPLSPSTSPTPSSDCQDTSPETPPTNPVSIGKVYVHFTGRDRRLDRWVNAADLQRAPPKIVAAAESGVVQNILVDSEVQAKFVADVPGSRKLTRSRRRAFEESNPVSEREVGNEAIARMERAREESTKVRNISSIVFGQYIVDAWYFSPYPHPYGSVDTLYICGNCLKYVRTSPRYVKHCSTCTWEHPPGTLLYSDPDHEVCVYEVDGLINPEYCERLCLLGKLFLDHKTLYFDVAPFLFYIVTVSDDLAGFFSKEKPECLSDYNLACILTLPQHQRKGIGRFLISFSYELSKKEGKIGGPERPLSDLGQLSYRSYWCYEIVQYLRTCRDSGKVPPGDIAKATGIQCSDVVAALKSLSLISIWKAETYADTRKDFDQIEQRISAPRLPVVSNLLKFGPSVHKPSTSNGRTTVRKRRKKQSPKLHSEHGPFSQHDLKRFSLFIRKHSAESVAAPMNSSEGISSEALHNLANELSMPLSRCRKKVKRMASQLLSNDHALNIVRSTSPRKVNGIENRMRRFSHQGAHSSSPDVVVKHERNASSTPRLSLCNELELVEMMPTRDRLAPRMSSATRMKAEMQNTEVVIIDPSPSSCE